MSYWSFAHNLIIITKLTNFNHLLISSIQDVGMCLNSMKSSFRILCIADFCLTFVSSYVCNYFFRGLRIAKTFVLVCVCSDFYFGLRLQWLLFCFAFAMTQANFLTFDPPRATQRLYFADWHSQIFSMRSTAWIDITFALISKKNSTLLSLLLQLWP